MHTMRCVTCCHLVCGKCNTKVDQLQTSLAGALDNAAATQQELDGEDAGRPTQRRRSAVQGLNGLERYRDGDGGARTTALLL